MKILFVNTQFPLFSAPNCGGANRSQMFLRALTQVGQVDVMSFWENEKSDLRNCEVIYSGRPDLSPTRPYTGITKFVKLLAVWRADSIFPLNRGVEEFFDKFIAQGKYDYIAVRYLYVAAECGLLKYADRLIIDIDDNPKDMYTLRAQQANSLPQIIYYRLASLTAGIVTRIVLSRVKCSFYVNPDRRPSRHSVLLHNVSAQNECLPPISSETPMHVVVAGSWWYYPNKFGLQHFVSNIWPKVRECIPNAELRVLGKGMEDSLRDLCNRIEGVNVLGFVDDIMQEYSQARCVVVPIYHGCGTCIKVIETMSVNRPFVSTPYGIRGIDNTIEDGKDFLLAKNDAIFADNIITLLQQPEYGALLASNALSCVQKHFSIEEFYKIVASSIK